MAERILIMGLPGAGKTTLARVIVDQFQLLNKVVKWFNADDIRKLHNDWDFSEEGRLRQAVRMRALADDSDADYVVCDFVAPLEAMRTTFDADWTVWVDTIEESRFDDTNKAFQVPTKYDFHINEQAAPIWGYLVARMIRDQVRRPVFDWKKETVQMLGRWQPWHEGHRKLFERAIIKTGQVVIQVRDCEGWNGSNPFAIEAVKRRIRKDLDMLYQGTYEIQIVPNIVNITYGRDVGYKIEQEVFDDATHQISATKIRKEMGLE
jgi:adenylylsulfate kinase